MKSTTPGMLTVYAVKHQAEADAKKAEAMRLANQIAFDNLRRLLDMGRRLANGEKDGRD